MNPFVAGQLNILVEDLRLLEAYITAPLGLYSDLRMLREALPLEEASELAQSEKQQRRLGYRGLSERPAEIALAIADQVELTLKIFERLSGDNAGTIKPEWISQARRVLGRVSHKLGRDLRTETASLVKGLYVIVDPENTGGRPVVEIAEEALKGGSSLLQLRDKTSQRGRVLQLAQQLMSLCQSYGALFVMNDDPALALSSKAHGLHIGQQDIPVSEARRVIQSDQIIGSSNNSIDEVVASQTLGLDYIAIGAVFPTSTMGKGDRRVVGTGLITKAKQTTDQPVVAIGGIDKDNAPDVVLAGADCVCVVGAITLDKNPRDAAARIKEAIQNAKKP